LKVVALHQNLEPLIRSAIKQNRKAQHSLFEMYAPKMLSVCRYYISDVHNAEEVMLDGFFKVFTNLHKFQFNGSFEGWIRKTMVRQAVDFLRSQKDIVFIEEVNHTPEKQGNHMDLFQDDYLQNLIDQLPEGYKMVFVLYAIEGYKHNEIAEMLNISEGTSKSQLSRARRMLQEQLKQINNNNYGTK
jgi:RNA polymerase sigma-70 factor (ECF subfamily)